MPVLVFNKRTSRYLRRHSGSYHHFISMMRWKKEWPAILKEKFGECPSWQTDREKHDEYQRNVHHFLIDQACNADPEDARIYASAGSALNSVGVLNPILRESWISRKNRAKDIHTYVLPSYFEIHEIKEAFMCIMRPDGSSNCDEEEEK